MPNPFRSAAGLSLVETLVGVVIATLVFAGLATMISALSSANRTNGDTVEAVDLERQLNAALADNGVCGCQLKDSPAMQDDVGSFSGATATTKTVKLARVSFSCDDPTRTFATVGGMMQAQSNSFVVDDISVRDLTATGRRDLSTGLPNEYMGSFFIRFKTRTAGRTPRPIKASKIFTTTPDGTRLVSCGSEVKMSAGPMVENSAMTLNLNPSVAACDPGYSIVSGGWIFDYTAPACPTVTNPQYPVVSDSEPIVNGGVNAWQLKVNCVTAAAIALCERGH